MKQREAFHAAAIHEAGHVAACMQLDIGFKEVGLRPGRNGRGLVDGAAHPIVELLTDGIVTAEVEQQSTNLIIMAFAGPVCEALREGRPSFEILDYPDLDPVLDMIEYRFSSNKVRTAFTLYCQAEAFALFEGDQRLWRYTNLLARELARKKRLTYEQCLELDTKEYQVTGWMRREE
jgi:hypothetical protein